MRLVPVFALGLVVLLLGAPFLASARGVSRVATPGAASGDFAGLVDIGGGRRLWLECRGQGGPTVVLEAGAGSSAAIWDTMALPPDSVATAVLPGVATFTRVCAYDRPGTVLDADHRGRSDPVPMPRTAADAVADLHALLNAAGEPGPYVLVGHSFGGIVARLYAATYSDEVAGLVLVDASHEEQNARYKEALTAEQWAAFERLQQQVPPDLAEYADLERIDFEASFAQMREAAAERPLPPLPLAVLTHGIPLGDELPPEALSALPADFPWDNFEAVWQALQADLAALGPEARQVTAAESGHYIQLQQPDLVIEAVRAVVEAAREPST
jgi:pimeloyl-ACP methyl ester carboxylesterase